MRVQPHQRGRASRTAAAAALAVALLLSPATGGGVGAQVEAPASPAGTSSDAAAPAGVGGAAPPSTAPLRSGFTPQSVAAATVPGPPQEAPPLTATGAVLFDPAEGAVLAGVDERTGRPMASLTKVMTVLLALEALEAGRVGTDVTVSEAAAATGRLPGVATLELDAGDVVDLRDLLAADLLRSGNDGAVAIAEHVAGSEEAYVAQMNARAAALGLEDTGFVDASGLTDAAAHRSSPLDLALLGHEAMSHPDFAAWAGADTLAVEPFGVLENRNELLGTYEGTTGIKTGYTERAGLCLLVSVERDGRTLYAVVLGSEDRVADSRALLDHGFAAFPRPTPLRPGDVAATYRTAAGEVPVGVAEELARTVGAGAAVTVRTLLAPDVGLPIEVGTPLGEAVLVVDGQEVDRTPLLADAALAAPADTPGAAVADALRGLARLAPRDAAVAL